MVGGEKIQLALFIVQALGTIVLVFYACQTKRIADQTKEQRKFEENEDRILEILRRTPLYGQYLEKISEGLGIPAGEAERALNRLASKGSVNANYDKALNKYSYWINEEPYNSIRKLGHHRAVLDNPKEGVTP